MTLSDEAHHRQAPTSTVRLGLAVTTVGRPELRDLLLSAAAATAPPDVVAVANQSGRDLPAGCAGTWPFEVRTVRGSAGVSHGRNTAAALVWDDVDVVATPNDDTRYEPGTLARARAAFGPAATAPDALAGTYLDHGVARFLLPPCGTRLGSRTVWRAAEPALFLRADRLRDLGGFREDLGAGAATPWQSGEGTDLLLRLIRRGGHVRSDPGLRVLGRGERRDLTDEEWILKNRRYARGTGYVYRIHDYPFARRLAVAAAPWLRKPDSSQRRTLHVRLAAARSLGRVEGLLGRTLPDVSARHVAR